MIEIGGIRENLKKNRQRTFVLRMSFYRILERRFFGEVWYFFALIGFLEKKNAYC